ncbi:hypothetical protein Agabi119p4_10470 [Agaricus bisporus var. burnettii]|uniref:Uncharacterized protein n=1 Tax=Agaricus bisporus var. burnettii TaxID=192524 RepID=A0A8H7C323_AGABI|nr:hypothetical protein Agabi119p4_10470 [Agaricus bisporus var. burnettii]
MLLSLFFLASQSTSFFIHKSIIHPFTRSIHPVLPYLGIWELAYITFSRVYFSPVACLLREGFSTIDTRATTFAYRLEELYWSLVFWPMLLMAAITGFPSFASEVAAAALRFLFGIASCRSVDFRRRQLDSRKNTARRIITMAPNSGTNGGGNATPPISTTGSGPVQPTPQISLREVSPPAYTRSISTSGTDSTTSSVTTSTSTQTLLPNVFHTRARSECSTVTPTRGLSPGKPNKFAAYPSPPTISSPLPTLHSPSAVFSSTSTHQTILITLPIENGGSSSSRTGTISASVSSLSSTSFTTTTLSSNFPSPSPAPAPTPTSSANPRSSSSSTTPLSSPHSSMLKFSTPPSPLKSKSKAKRVQSRKRTPVTTCAISPLRRSPTPYPSFANPSRASASLMKLTPSTPTTPKQNSRSTVKTVVVTPTPKSKHHQQQQFGRGTRKRGSTKGSGPGNTNANAGSVSKTVSRGKTNGAINSMMENGNERCRHPV